ncbi:hypothetical protein [Cypionkella sinensis]|uniref:hypothetical protein n=1 Tax=Cypionkella sinensis TaxID=1756043 RepID=UPI0036296D9C
MSKNIHNDLINLSTAYAAHKNLSHWRVSYLARGDGQFFRRLADGKSCTVKTAAQVLQWFSDIWPLDLEWPSDISRPPRSKKEAA